MLACDAGQNFIAGKLAYGVSECKLRAKASLGHEILHHGRKSFLIEQFLKRFIQSWLYRRVFISI